MCTSKDKQLLLSLPNQGCCVDRDTQLKLSRLLLMLFSHSLRIHPFKITAFFTSCKCSSRKASHWVHHKCFWAVLTELALSSPVSSWEFPSCYNCYCFPVASKLLLVTWREWGGVLWCIVCFCWWKRGRQFDFLWPSLLVPSNLFLWIQSLMRFVLVPRVINVGQGCCGPL